MRIIEVTLDELMKQGLQDQNGSQDYIQAVLTDEIELLDPMSSLRSVYPNTMQIVLKKHMKDREESFTLGLTVARQSKEELFCGFYELLKGEEMDDVRRAIVREVAEEAEK